MKLIIVLIVVSEKIEFLMKTIICVYVRMDIMIIKKNA